jgi:hypothetical protein
MPNHYSVLNDSNLVMEFWMGHVTQQEILAHERRHLNDPLIQPGASVLVDAMQASFESTVDEVKKIAGLYSRVAGRLKVGRVAILVNRDAYERALVFLKEVQGYGVNVIVFSSLDIACTWLGIDAAIARAELRLLRMREV